MLKRVMVYSLAVALLLSIMISMTACNKPSGNASSTDGILKADISLWMYPQIPDESVATNFFDTVVKPAFKEVQPNVTLKVEYLTWDGGPNKVNVAMAAGNTPDVLWDSPQRVYGYVGKGVMEPLDDVITAVTDSIFESVKDICLVEGKRYSAATGLYVGGLAVNTTLAKKLGTYEMLPEDRRSWSFAEYKAFLKACTDKGKAEGIYGTTLWAGSQSADTTTFGFLMIGGATVFNDARDKVVLNSKEGIRGLEYLMSLVDEGIVAPGAATMTDEDAYALFLAQKSVVDSIGTISSILTAKTMIDNGEIEGPFDIELYEYPYYDANTPRSKYAIYFPSGFSIFTNAGDQDKIQASKEFIKLMIGNDEISEEFTTLCGLSPANPKINIFKDNAVAESEFKILTSWVDNNIAAYGQEKAYWSEIRSVFYPEVQAAYSGAKTAKQALDDFAANANAIVAENESK